MRGERKAAFTWSCKSVWAWGETWVDIWRDTRAVWHSLLRGAFCRPPQCNHRVILRINANKYKLSSIKDVRIQLLVFAPYLPLVHKVGQLDLWSKGRGFNFHRGQLRSNPGQAVHTYVPLSPSSITWYWLKNGEILRLGRWLQAWRKVTAAYRRRWL